MHLVSFACKNGVFQRLGTVFTIHRANSSHREERLGNLLIDLPATFYYEPFPPEPFPPEVSWNFHFSAKFGESFTVKVPGKFYVRTFTPWKFFNTRCHTKHEACCAGVSMVGMVGTILMVWCVSYRLLKSRLAIDSFAFPNLSRKKVRTMAAAGGRGGTERSLSGAIYAAIYRVWRW